MKYDVFLLLFDKIFGRYKSILKTGKAKAVRFSALEAICKELDCQPGDRNIKVENSSIEYVLSFIVSLAICSLEGNDSATFHELLN